MKRFIISAALVLALLLPALPGAAEIPLSKGQVLYVPVYSHIYYGIKSRPLNLTVTLSVRNIDPKHSLTLAAVEYYDTDGKLIRKYLDKPQALGPLGTSEFVIGELDSAGGSGANFIVRWTSASPVNVPVIEAVMVGASQGQGVSFTSRAVEIRE